jgi:hypothetical protein
VWTSACAARYDAGGSHNEQLPCGSRRQVPNFPVPAQKPCLPTGWRRGSEILCCASKRISRSCRWTHDHVQGDGSTGDVGDGSWGGTNPPMPWGWRGGKNNSGVYDNVSTPLFQCVFKESWENCDASRGDYAGNGSCLSRMTRFLIEGVEGRCSMTRSLTCGGRQRLQSTPASTRTRGSET